MSNHQQVLSLIIPGSSEASFSLVSFIDLVKREWHEPAFDHTLPERYRKFGVTELARALISWVALQGDVVNFSQLKATRLIVYRGNARVARKKVAQSHERD